MLNEREKKIKILQEKHKEEIRELNLKQDKSVLDWNRFNFSDKDTVQYRRDIAALRLKHKKELENCIKKMLKSVKDYEL